MIHNNYLLITPIKDEKDNLEQLKTTVLNQSLKPCLWVIIDGRSIDGSFEYAKSVFSQLEWVYVIKQKKFFERGYSHKNFAQAVNEGYVFAQSICKQNKIAYDFIGKIDATVSLQKDYFESLLNEMIQDPKMAIICGQQYMKNHNRVTVIQPNINDKLSGFNDCRLYRKTFFESNLGYPLCYSPDTILLIRAFSTGWHTRISEHATFFDNRMGGTKIGFWKGFELKGESMYCLGYSFEIVMLNMLYYCVKTYPHYTGLALVIGYLRALGTKDKIQDPQVLHYLGKVRTIELIKSYILK